MKKQPNTKSEFRENGLSVVALGGAGGMGQFAIETAVNFDFVKKIVIADFNEQRAKKIANTYGRKVSAVKLDASDLNRVYTVIRQSDVVMSTLGPYFKYGVPILKVAIDAGCDYIDICDDWQPTLQMAELDGEAKRKGVTAVIGLGASPGISNLLAVKIIDELDRVDDLVTGWGEGEKKGNSSFELPGRGGSYRAAMEHLVHELTSDIKIWKEGVLRTVRPMAKIKIDYPGYGRKSLYTVGHPESVTLFKLKPEIRNCLNVMDLPKEMIRPVYWLINEVNNSRMSLNKAVDNMLSVERGILPMLSCPLGRKVIWNGIMLEMKGIRSKSLPGLFAYATGTKDGKSARVSAHLNALPFGGLTKDTMGSLTGVPLAVGLHVFFDNKGKKPGVFAPESIFDPDRFFNLLAPLCTPGQADGNELVIKRVETDNA